MDDSRGLRAGSSPFIEVPPRRCDNAGFLTPGCRVRDSSIDPNPVYTAVGMPALTAATRATSFFEFWPTPVMYLPVVLQCLALSLRYRSASLPLIANPALPLSGMVGCPKSAVFVALGPPWDAHRLPWTVYTVSSAPLETQVAAVFSGWTAAGLALPLVAKPDLGCRGSGVKLLRSETDLAGYLSGFPVGAAVVFQQLAAWEPEAGIFYVRRPGAAQGEITSLTFKYAPYVVGDGVATLAELVARDHRAGGLTHLYAQRLAARWHEVIPAGEAVRLVFSVSHCRGAVFRNGAAHITPALTARLDELFSSVPGFHYGRLDVKFPTLERLTAGGEFVVLEINGASAESIHIWDRDTRLSHALGTLLKQYRTLYALGHANREAGHRPPGLAALWRAWRQESRLSRAYPVND